MKTPSAELFNLIKSLNAREKAQFKGYASRTKEDSNYARLFNAIDKQKVYDEALIKLKFKKEPFIKHLDFVKSYVAKAILKCLQEYYSSESIPATLGNLIQQIEILINKRLFGWAKKMIAKAEKLAEKNDEYYLLSSILLLKRQTLAAEANMEEIKSYAESHYLNEIKCLEIIKNLIDYGKLHMQAAGVMCTHFEAPADRYAELTKLLATPLLQDEAKAISFPAKLRHYSILGDVFLLLGDWEKCYLNYKKVIELMERHPGWLATKQEFYLMWMNNFFIAMIQLKKDRELAVLYNKVRRFVESLPKKLQSNIIFKRYMAININYMEYHLLSFNIPSALKLSEELKNDITKHYDTNLFLAFHFNLFLMHFYLNDYRKALQAINEILNNTETGIREDLIHQSKLLNIIVHYELGNEELLPGLCKSTARYLKKKGDLGQTEKMIFDFFGKTILKADTRQEKTNVFRKFKKELEWGAGKKALPDFDLISWVDSKMEGKSFLEVRKEKAKQLSI